MVSEQLSVGPDAFIKHCSYYALYSEGKSLSSDGAPAASASIGVGEDFMRKEFLNKIRDI